LAQVSTVAVSARERAGLRVSPTGGPPTVFGSIRRSSHELSFASIGCLEAKMANCRGRRLIENLRAVAQ